MGLPDEPAAALDWFGRRTFDARGTDPAGLADLKAGRSVSAVLPARDEATTVGAIVTSVREQLVERSGLVDEVIVVDSRSSDDTARVARDAGATVHPVEDLDGVDGGKGAALRTGVARMSGDLGVFLDADVRDFGVDFVVGLLDPLLRDDSLVLVKAFYDRPWTGSGAEATTGGGRVTELVARPLIAQRAPLLSGFVQPLAGEVAFRRDAVVDLPFATGYAVDIAMLLQVLDVHGLDAMGQADLGRRVHRHQDLAALGRMAVQVGAAFDLVLDGHDEVVRERSVLTRNAAGTMQLGSETVTTRLLPSPSRGVAR